MKLKSKTQLAVYLVVAAFAVQASAKTNVQQKVEQLKGNTEASKINLKQYEDNLKIVDENLSENAKAITRSTRKTGLLKM